MRFARWVFFVSGTLGVLIIVPLYFMEDRLGQDYPPAINHPEFYYGFAGVTLAWQLLFLVIASDPVRYRPAMLPAQMEKAGFAFAIPILYSLGRVDAVWLTAAAVDATWLGLFAVAYGKTPTLKKSKGWPGLE